MPVENYDFGEDGPTEEDMLRILAVRVRRVFGMTLDEYVEARRARTLPDVPGRAALEVFAGDFGLDSSRQ